MEEGSCSVHFYDENEVDLEDDPDEPPRHFKFVDHQLNDIIRQ
jgi:hypothetical protein